MSRLGIGEIGWNWSGFPTCEICFGWNTGDNILWQEKRSSHENILIIIIIAVVKIKMAAIAFTGSHRRRRCRFAAADAGDGCEILTNRGSRSRFTTGFVCLYAC